MDIRDVQAIRTGQAVRIPRAPQFTQDPPHPALGNVASAEEVAALRAEVARLKQEVARASAALAQTVKTVNGLVRALKARAPSGKAAPSQPSPQTMAAIERLPQSASGAPLQSAAIQAEGAEAQAAAEDEFFGRASEAFTEGGDDEGADG